MSVLLKLLCIQHRSYTVSPSQPAKKACPAHIHCQSGQSASGERYTRGVGDQAYSYPTRYEQVFNLQLSPVPLAEQNTHWVERYRLCVQSVRNSNRMRRRKKKCSYKFTGRMCPLPLSPSSGSMGKTGIHSSTYVSSHKFSFAPSWRKES